jgi:predicted CXXCH cytochrome family protein
VKRWPLLDRALLLALGVAFGLASFPFAAPGTDLPHTDGPDSCANCHLPHRAPGGSLLSVAGNANLCQSCHVAGGQAASLALPNSEQARPWPGLPADIPAQGTSHRWDSGPAGHVMPGFTNTSTGAVSTRGSYTGVYAKTYIITITLGGESGVARFDWTATLPGGGSGTNLLTGTNVVLDQGVLASFANGASPSFAANDRWFVFVRPQLQSPSDLDLLARTENGQVLCSTCHDPHSQANPPFDPNALAYGGTNSGAGRHYLVVPNNADQICVDCHAPLAAAAATRASHPLGVGVPSAGPYQPPAGLPLEKGTAQIRCETCHQVHFSPATDGSLLRLSDRLAVCSECHTLADTLSPAAHLSPTNAATLWPGGEYGSLFPPITDTDLTGSCSTCHRVHGWPNATNTSVVYPSLLADVEENLCFTCHDLDGPSRWDLRSEFNKTQRHPLDLAMGVHSNAEPALVTARHVECADCHNPHQATRRLSLPGPGTTPRPAAGPLAGVVGIDVTGADVNPAQFEYEVCFRCHANSPGQASPATSRQVANTNLRLAFNGSALSSHPVTVAGKNPYVPSLMGGWTTNSIVACTDCHNNDAGPNAGGSGPNGPHGSTNAALLERVYSTADGFSYDEAAYALCFKCHNPTSILADASFSEHTRHIVGEGAACNICHDPHASPGQAKLINFDQNVVGPSLANGRLEYISTGSFRGQCSLTCHGVDHDATTYSP